MQFKNKYLDTSKRKLTNRFLFSKKNKRNPPQTHRLLHRAIVYHAHQCGLLMYRSFNSLSPTDSTFWYPVGVLFITAEWSSRCGCKRQLLVVVAYSESPRASLGVDRSLRSDRRCFRRPLAYHRVKVVKDNTQRSRAINERMWHTFTCLVLLVTLVEVNFCRRAIQSSTNGLETVYEVPQSSKDNGKHYHINHPCH